VLTRNAGDETDTEAFPGALLKKGPKSEGPLPLTDARVLLIDERLYFEAADEEDDRSRTLPELSVTAPRDVDRADAVLADRVLT